jgi:hypothetical protein
VTTANVTVQPASTRVSETIEGITCDYAPADAALARALAPLIAALDRDAAAPAPVTAAATADAPVTPLSIADFRRNREDYLARLAAAIGLKRPTARQVECYDGYLDNFERTEQVMARLMDHVGEALLIHAVTIVHKTDVLTRLKAGEKIPGFTLDEDGEHVTAQWAPPQINGRDERLVELLKQREQGQLDLGYNYAVKDGIAEFSATTKMGHSAAAPADKGPAPLAEPIAAPTAPIVPFPVVIMPEQEDFTPAELAERLATQIGDLLRKPRQMHVTQFQNAGVLANLLLHETTETGIMDRYIGSRDRRWLCEGVANYTAWKIVRDRAGEAAARQVYDLAGQLALYPDLREKVDLRKWPAVENQHKEDANTPLNRAHYAFAARAVFLIAERHGDDFLPKLFQEIGKTPRTKTAMRTVETAYRKLAREDLSTVLAAAVAPVPTTAPASPATTK